MLLNGCITSTEPTVANTFIPMPSFCYTAYNETARCFPSREQCINEEHLHDDVSTRPCRMIYIAK